MNRIFCKFTHKKPPLIVLIGITTFGTATLLNVSAQAGLTFTPLPSEQASIILPSQIATPSLSSNNPRQTDGVDVPSPLQPSNKPTDATLAKSLDPNTPSMSPSNTFTKSNGQDYYTIPDSADDKPLPIPADEPMLSNNQPDIVPFSNQISDITSNIKPSQSTNVQHPRTTKKNREKTTTSDKESGKQASKPATKQTGETVPKPIKEKVVPSIKKATLRFSDFPAKTYTGKRVAPKISTLKNLNGFYVEALRGTKGEKQFITTLSKTKPNYAGHYVITSFTCGLNCIASVAYDVKTGDFMELGGGFADCPATDFNPRQKASVTHHVNSRLLIVIGSSASGSCVAGYFEEKNGNVSLISQKNIMTFVETR